MKNFKLLTFGVVMFSGLVQAQEIDYSKTIPFDASIKTGKLQNGLTYYIKKNAKPEKKVDLRLIVNAGSVLEDDNQLGLAHFMEHMCFNGTKRFPKNALVDYLQSIGVKFGQHLNAYTSFDETVYFLPIPADNPEKVEKGFQILEDWAFNAVLTPEEIDKERGVVLEEYRLGLGAQKRMMGRFLPKIMNNSKYAERLPIGKKEILEKFNYETLTKFYKDWYRPNLMSVIIVGDIDVAEMEKKVIEHFGSYQNPKNERVRQFFEVPNHKETFVAIESDKEASSTQVQLMYKDKEAVKPIVTVGDFKKYIVEELFTSMINARLDELANSATPPYTYAYSYHGKTWSRNKTAYQSFAMTGEDKQLNTLKVLVQENEKVKKFGFTQGELDRAKADFLAGLEKQFNDKDKTSSDRFVNELQSHFLTQEPVPGIVWTYDLAKKITPVISLNETNELIKKFISDENRVVILTGPEKEGLKKVTEAEVFKMLEVNEGDIKAYEDKAVAKALLRTEPKAGSIVKKEVNDKIGTTILTLSNGAKVTYKKTDFKNDEIVFEAVSLGGSNLFSDEVQKKVGFALGGLSEAGYSGLKLNDITKFMTGKIASVNPYIGNATEGLRGSSTPKDLEYMLQMAHAYFTDLNQDKEAFEAFKQKQTNFFKNISAQPNFFFQQEFQSFLNKDNKRFMGLIPTEETWVKMDYELAYRLYKERFSNAADFEFFFVGNIEEKQFEALVGKYIASLPSIGKKETTKDTGYRNVAGSHKKVVNKGKDPKSMVNINIYGDAQYSAKDALALQAVGEILTIKLNERLRETESGVYGAGAKGSMNKIPYGSYNFSISFPCGPENAEKLTASALDELNKLIVNGPEEKDLTKFKEGEIQDYRKEIKENKTWLGYFTKSYVNGSKADEILTFEAKVNALTVKELQEAAKKYLAKDKVIGMLMPEANN
ncbi:pitrilysin family protein [Flavobacterium sp. H122]|uniref:M16 family metallopeptidase n=1 Tax=Flavobacterium sp. H122 TaxID=2529860 RepID=UPI0010A9C8F4|nr:insulinase family protein [Flavobacterium sp. H122]